MIIILQIGLFWRFFNFLSAKNAPNGTSDAINRVIHHCVESVFLIQIAPKVRQKIIVTNPCPIPKIMLILLIPSPYFNGIPMNNNNKYDTPSISDMFLKVAIFGFIMS